VRFGITPLDFADVLSRILQGDQIDFSRFCYPEIVKNAASAGFVHVEITLDVLHALPGSLNNDRIAEISEIRKSEELTLSAHLPLWAVEPASFNERIRKASVETCIEAIELAEGFQPEYYVFHATGALASEFSRLPYPRRSVDLINLSMASNASRSTAELLKQTGIDPKRLALESVEFPLDLTVSTAEETGCSVVLDTGHILGGFSETLSLMEALELFRQRLIGLHLHDGFRRKNEDGSMLLRDHLPLGSGDMNIQDFFGALTRFGFDGPAVFELSMSGALQSIEVVRKLVPGLFST